MAIIIDGKKISSDIKNELKARVENITAKRNKTETSSASCR
jgi:5,10-methylene-tetrahydrofolate dehydrogenase/methenyl tetrahydrofolate cyclohydrolase